MQVLVDTPACGAISVVLPDPGVIAAPATILVETPLGATFAATAVSWPALGSAYLAGYVIEFRPASIVVWQGYAGGFGATAVAIPTAEPTAFRVRAQARTVAADGRNRPWIRFVHAT